MVDGMGEGDPAEAKRRGPMTITASHRVYGLAAIMFAALLACARVPGGVGTPAYLITLVIAGVAYLLAIREFFSTPRFPRRVIVIGLALAALWHLPFLLMPAGADDDVHRYVWDGRMQRLGFNPYVVVPNDPAFSALHTDETRNLNNPEVPSPYPAGAQLFFRAVTAIHESALAFKVAFVLCELAIVPLLLAELRRVGLGEHWVLAYAWNPLLVTCVTYSGHVDILGVLLLLVSVAALERRWRTFAAIAFGLAVAVKFLPVVLAPLYWRRVRVRDGLFALLIVGLLYVPFLGGGSVPTGSISVFVERFRFNDPVFAEVERVVRPQVVAGLAALVGLITTAVLRRRHDAYSPQTFAWPMAASLLCAPVVYPWYLLWLLPFVRSVSTVPLIIWTISILPTFYVWHLRTLGGQWVVPGWIVLLEYGTVAAAAAILEFRRLRRSTSAAA
jgi:alpha-1,6-mannosyltransferase